MSWLRTQIRYFPYRVLFFKNKLKRIWEKIKRKTYEKVVRFLDWYIRKLDKFVDKVDDKLLLLINGEWVR